jgi:hypothetical protein
MKYVSQLVLLVAINMLGCRPAPSTPEQLSQLRPDLPPVIHILNVDVPGNHSQPLSLKLELVPTGRTPVAIDRANFAFELSRPGVYSQDYGDVIFSNNAPEIIVVQPGTNLVVNAMILTNSSNQPWNRYGHGKYDLRVSTGSGKRRHFDYEWMGQLHSDRYEFEVK